MGQKFNSGRDGQPHQHHGEEIIGHAENMDCLLYTSPSPRDS